MTTQEEPYDRDTERMEGQILIHRFTDQLAGSNELERTTRAAQDQIDNDIEAEHQARMKMLYEDSNKDHS